MSIRHLSVPVCLWRDAGGLVGGCLAEWPNVSAVGEDEKAVLLQLGDYLEWRREEQPWFPEPDFFDPVLQRFAVEVYPAYRRGDKLFPVLEPVVLDVPCLSGHNENDQGVVSLPLQQMVFQSYDTDSLKKLVTHFVQQVQSERTPQQLSRQLAPPEVWIGQIGYKSRGDVAKRLKEVPKVLLEVAEPLGDRAARRQFGRAWERDALVRQLVDWLLGETSSILLVGEPGVGKSTILAEAVREVERREAAHPRDSEQHDQLKGPRFWLTGAGRLIAGMQYLGQWQARCEDVIQALSELRGVLCLDSLMGLVRTGGSGPTDSLAAFFRPFIQHGELRMIAEATPAELDACRRLMPGFADAFRILTVPAMERSTALRVLEKLQQQAQHEGGPTAGHGALEQIWHLFHRFAPYSPFPGQPVRFLQQLLERVRAPQQLTLEQVTTLFSERTGLPELLLRDDLPLDYAELLAQLQTRVVGQPAACALAARVLTQFKAGLNDPARPIGVLLFCGPTGVGKTALARAMAEFLLGDQTGSRMIRLDMSEYAGPFALTRLTTGPQGEPAEWLQRIRRQPFQLLLLDEIEKADAAVFDILLGMLDEGRLTDPYGRTLHFQSTLIVMTSNLGADAPAALGFGAVSRPDYSKAVQAFFRPELFNRLDAVLPFAPLGAAQIATIAATELSQLARREGLSAQRLQLGWTPAVVDHLAAVGFDPRYGARPLQRAVEREVAAPLAHYLLAHPGLSDRKLELDVVAGEVRIRDVAATTSP